MRASELAARIGARHIEGPDREVERPCLPGRPLENGVCLALTLAAFPIPAPAAVIIPSDKISDFRARARAFAPDSSLLAAPTPKSAYARAVEVMGPDRSDAIGAGLVESLPHFRGRDVVIGEGCVFGPGVVVGDGTRIGNFSVFGAHVVLGPNVTIGNRVRIGPLTSIGHAPFDYARDGGRWLPLPGLGGVVVEDDAMLGARVSVPAGCSRPTRIGSDCKLDDGVHVGHDAIVGPGTVMAAGAKLAGYVRLGSLCRIGGQAAIAEGIVIADAVTVTATSAVSRDVTVPGQTIASGWPAMPARQWWRVVSRVRALDPLRNSRSRDG